jgi:hypothetical protein
VRPSKGKAVPLQAWSGPGGSRKLRFPDFMTMAHDGGKVVSLTHRPPLPPRKYTWYSFLLEAAVNRLRADCSPLSTGSLHGRSQRVTIPDAVKIQY